MKAESTAFPALQSAMVALAEEALESLSRQFVRVVGPEIPRV